MNAIALIIALLVERFGADLDGYRSADRYLGLLRWLRDKVGRGGFWDGWFGVLLLLTPAALAMAVFEDVFAEPGVLGGMLGAALSAWILFWCLTPLVIRVRRGGIAVCVWTASRRYCGWSSV